MKQYLIELSWYESDTLAIIKAPNKTKALVKLIKSHIDNDKATGDIEMFNLPHAYYDDDLTERQNIAKYLQQIRNKDVSLKCFEITPDTDAIVMWDSNYSLKPILED